MKKCIYLRAVASFGACAALFTQNYTAFSQTPTTSNGLFELFQAKNDMTWSGSDQATSYRASNGKVYWLFGDTVLGTRNPATGGYNAGWYMVANTILVESNGILNGATLTAPAVPNADDGDRYWGQGIFEANGYLYILCERVHNANNAIGFITLGAELAKFQFQSNGQLTFLGMVSTPGTRITQGTGTATIQWTDDVVAYGGYVYIFGDAGTGVNLSPKAGYVSRVTMADVENTNSWTFWNGSSWVTNMLNSAQIVADMPSSVRLYGGEWVILYKPFAGAGSQVKVAIGSSPQGPYSSGQVIFQSPGGTTSNGVTATLRCYQTYNPQSHPEYPLSSGKLLVSIAWNGCDLFNDTANDAQLYKPRFYEIALTGIPPVYPPVSLTIERAGTNLVLSWPEGTLLETTTITSVWTTNYAMSPYTNPLSTTGKFYRVRVR